MRLPETISRGKEKMYIVYKKKYFFILTNLIKFWSIKGWNFIFDICREFSANLEIFRPP